MKPSEQEKDQLIAELMKKCEELTDENNRLRLKRQVQRELLKPNERRDGEAT